MVHTEAIIPSAMAGVPGEHPDRAEAPGIESPAASARIAQGYFGFSTHAPQDALP
jgi:hypothetical protein